jgi:hypothetical protein
VSEGPGMAQSPPTSVLQPAVSISQRLGKQSEGLGVTGSNWTEVTAIESRHLGQDRTAVRVSSRERGPSGFDDSSPGLQLAPVARCHRRKRRSGTVGGSLAASALPPCHLSAPRPTASAITTFRGRSDWT